MLERAVWFRLTWGVIFHHWLVADRQQGSEREASKPTCECVPFHCLLERAVWFRLTLGVHDGLVAAAETENCRVCLSPLAPGEPVTVIGIRTDPRAGASGASWVRICE